MSSQGDGSDRPDREAPTRTGRGAGSENDAPTRGGVQPPIPAAAKPALLRGATVGRYVVLDLLGEGGMGSVYCAYDPQLSRKVALKLLKPEAGGSEAQLRILREAQAMAQVSHPNVVAIYDVGTHQDGVFLAMELVDGQTLRHWLKQERPWREKLRTMIDAGRGLSAAHARGLVHRDFKPDNVLVGGDGRVHVTDFGLARAENEMELSRSIPTAAFRMKAVSVSSNLTAEGMVVGTAGYMPLEQLTSDAVDAKSDQFSFAVTTWLALFGKRPFSGSTIDAYMKELESKIPEPPSNSPVPSPIKRALIKALSKNPEDRFETLDALLKELERDPRQQLRAFAPVGVIAIALLVAGMGIALARSRAQNACEGTGSSMAGLWTQSVKDTIRSRLLSADPAGQDVWKQVESNLDSYAAEWTEVATDACRITRVEGKEPLDALVLKESCLERQQLEFKAATELLAKADADVLAKALQATSSLSRPRWCRDARLLKDNEGLPEDPLKRTAVKEVQKTIAAAEALSRAGKHPDAVSKGKEAVLAAKNTGWKPLEAETLLKLGQMQADADDPPGAAASLQEAFVAASQCGRRRLAAEAAIDVSANQSGKFHRGAEADVWLVVARANLDTSDGDDRLQVKWDVASGTSLRVQRKYADATAAFERALTGGTRVYATDGAELGTILGQLGTNLVLAGRIEEGQERMRQALGMLEKSLGPTHYRVARLQNNLGATLVERAQFQDAKELLEHALHAPHSLTADGDMNSYFYENLAQAVLALGDAKQALDYAKQALSASEKFRDDPAFRGVYGWALLANGQAAQAYDECSHSWQTLQKEGLDPASRVAFEEDALTCMGEAQLAQNHADAAIPLFEKALTFPIKYPGGMARTRFSLAKALSAQKGDATRIKTLTAQALDELKSLAGRPPFDARKAEVEKWMVSH